MTGRDRDTCHLSYLSKSTDYLKNKKKQKKNPIQIKMGGDWRELKNLKKKKRKKNAANEFLPLFAALQQQQQKKRKLIFCYVKWFRYAINKQGL